jgi:hypothetical protein
MPQTEFDRENLGRAYPFVDTTQHTWLFPVLADASVIVRPQARYTHGQHRINLYAIGQLTSSQANSLGVTGSVYFLAFSCTAVPLRQEILLFAFAGGLPRYTEINGVVIPIALFNTVVFGMSAPADTVIAAVNKWEGYVVLGDYMDIPVSPTMLSPVPYLEPARITNTVETIGGIGKTYVYNQRMTQYRQPAGCETFNDEAGSELAEYVLAGPPILGEFRIAAGHSVRVSQNTRNRVLTLLADPTGGELGTACGPVPPAPDVDDTDTSPRCSEVLRSINGASGPILSLSALDSVEIGRYPSQHRVVIAPVGSDSAACPATEDASPVTHIPNNADDQPCGDDGQPVPPPPGPPNKGAGYVTVTTTTTTSAAASGNMCRWEGDGSQWYLTEYPCLSPNGCSEPLTSPVDEAVEFTACQFINDSDGVFILNPMFTAAAPFSAWDRVGNVELLAADDEIPALSLPVARLAPSGSGASLLQRMISIPSNSSFVLYFECRVLQGMAEIAIGTENNFADAVRLTVSAATNAQWGEIAVTSLNFVSGPLRLVITAGEATVLDIGQFALIEQ